MHIALNLADVSVQSQLVVPSASALSLFTVSLVATCWHTLHAVLLAGVNHSDICFCRVEAAFEQSDVRESRYKAAVLPFFAPILLL